MSYDTAQGCKWQRQKDARAPLHLTRIALTGFMGCGKSTVGKMLSGMLAYNFIDLDHEIERQRGLSVAAIFESEGEEQFRLYEHQTLKKIVADESKTLIACGGGAPCFHHNMDLLNQYCVTVYLQAGVEELFENLYPQTACRPLLKNKSPGALREYIASTLALRESTYRQAQIIIRTKGKNPEEISTAIMAVLSSQ